jgi:hypothetical protein
MTVSSAQPKLKPRGNNPAAPSSLAGTHPCRRADESDRARLNWCLSALCWRVLLNTLHSGLMQKLQNHHGFDW